MKKIGVLIFIILILLIKAFGQERINAPLPLIQQKINSQLTQSKGWMLNPEGQWVSRENRIPVYIEHQFKDLIDSHKYGLGYDNFISYQFRDIIINNYTYTIFIKRYKYGYYRYPIIEEDWISKNRVQFYVFEKSELSKLDSIKDERSNLIEINYLYSNNLNYTNNDYMSSIQNDIAKRSIGGNSKYEQYLCFNIATYKSKNIVQYQIYSYYKVGAHSTIINGLINNHLNYASFIVPDILLGFCYYEVDYTTFNQFIKLN